jgi:hypothetical protein
LLQIAERCPLIDGDAVYHARALYARFDPDRIFDNGLYCQPTQQSFRAQLPVEESTQLRLFPNPAENYVLVQADQSIEVESVRVFNATGQQQEVETLAGEDFQLFLGTERLPSGVYFVQLRLVNAEGVMSQKFIIQRD